MVLDYRLLVDVAVRSDREDLLGDLDVLSVDPLLLELPEDRVVSCLLRGLQRMEVTRLRKGSLVLDGRNQLRRRTLLQPVQESESGDAGLSRALSPLDFD